ncbi:MAG: hypothetical protein FJ104_15710, partial [Deltaproteobacteria bacterium]|nr:hypothetical protein [Deltaproteobacteria bacterium]
MRSLLLAVTSLSLAGAGCRVDRSQRRQPDMAEFSQRAPVRSETGLEATLQLGVGALELSAGRGPDLYALELVYDKARYSPEIRYREGSVGRLSIALAGKDRQRRLHDPRNRIRLGLTETLPLRLAVKNGVGEARLSLSGLRIENLDVESGVGSTQVSAYEPNPVGCQEVRLRTGVGGLKTTGLANLNFRELAFDGGVGGAELDFTGDFRRDAEIRIRVGIGGVVVRVPRGIGVVVDAEKHFLSGFQLDGF